MEDTYAPLMENKPMLVEVKSMTGNTSELIMHDGHFYVIVFPIFSQEGSNFASIHCQGDQCT